VLLALSVNSLCNGLDYVRPERIRAAIDRGELPAYRIGNKIRILTSDAEAWIRTFPRVGVKDDTIDA
jgi:excisionase family DNA binding protein